VAKVFDDLLEAANFGCVDELAHVVRDLLDAARVAAVALGMGGSDETTNTKRSRNQVLIASPCATALPASPPRPACADSSAWMVSPASRAAGLMHTNTRVFALPPAGRGREQELWKTSKMQGRGYPCELAPKMRAHRTPRSLPPCGPPSARVREHQSARLITMCPANAYAVQPCLCRPHWVIILFTHHHLFALALHRVPRPLCPPCCRPSESLRSIVSLCSR